MSWWVNRTIKPSGLYYCNSYELILRQAPQEYLLCALSMTIFNYIFTQEYFLLSTFLEFSVIPREMRNPFLFHLWRFWLFIYKSIFTPRVLPPGRISGFRILFFWFFLLRYFYLSKIIILFNISNSVLII